MNRFNVIAFATAITVGAVIGSLAPANAGLFTDVVKGVNNKLQNKLQNNRPAATPAPAPQQQAQGKSQWDFLGNKPYLDCLKFMNTWNNPTEQMKENGRKICNRKYYGHD